MPDCVNWKAHMRSHGVMESNWLSTEGIMYNVSQKNCFSESCYTHTQADGNILQLCKSKEQTADAYNQHSIIFEWRKEKFFSKKNFPQSSVERKIFFLCHHDPFLAFQQMCMESYIDCCHAISLVFVCACVSLYIFIHRTTTQHKHISKRDSCGFFHRVFNVLRKNCSFTQNRAYSNSSSLRTFVSFNWTFYLYNSKNFILASCTSSDH